MEVYQMLHSTGEEEVSPRAVPIPGSWDKWFIHKFFHGARGGRLTPERFRELWIGSILWPKAKEALLHMLWNGEYAVSWTW
jgi:hypothetical protein